MASASRILKVLCTAVAGFTIAASSASAATINVTQDLDSNFFEPGCALRDAVEAANLNADFGTCDGDTAGADTIVLQSGHTYFLNNIGVVDDSNGLPGMPETKGAGDLDIKSPLTITTDGAGPATVAGNGVAVGMDPAVALANRDRVIQVHDPGGPVTLNNLKISGGWVQQAGSVGGGGVLSAQPLTITNSEITGNRVEVSNTNTFGGGIFVRGLLGSLNISNSAVNENAGQAAGTGQVVGGGIATYSGATSLTMTNNTVSGNTVTGAGTIGAVGGVFAGDNLSPTPATLNFNTITDNKALNPGGSTTGGIQVYNGTLTGNIVAGNTDPFDLFPDCNGFPTSGGGNVIGDTGNSSSCLFTGEDAGPNDLVGVDNDVAVDPPTVNPNLGTLVNNGGPTRTHALNPASPAIDRAAGCPSIDQRGFFRAVAAPCDSGAFELGASATPPPPTAVAGPTGQRAAALKKCKKKKSKKAKKKCRKKAKKLPL